MEISSFETIVQKTSLFLTGSFLFFTLLGVLVLVGLRAEVGRLLRGLFEGTLRIIDVVDIFRRVVERLTSLLKSLLNFLSPTIALGLATVAYYYLMLLYKTVGRNHDVTVLTVVLTVLLVSVLSLFGGFSGGQSESMGFWKAWFKNMHIYLFNSLEIMVFIFFLTVDWETPFFLSSDLWGPVSARVGNFDLMERGVNIRSGAFFTLWLAGLAVVLEVLRRFLRILAGAVSRYRKVFYVSGGRLFRFKRALVTSFNDNLDSIVKFLGFTTVVTLAFFLFPRLKLLSLVLFSLTSLVWDILLPRRMAASVSGEDFFSSLVVKTFGL